jgi:hypothetical protein
VNAVTFNESEVRPLGIAFIGDGSLTLTPEGTLPTHEADRVTDELKPFSDNTLTITALLLPAGKVTDEFELI